MFDDFVQTSNATTSNQNQALNHHSAAAAPAAGGLGLSSPQQDQLGLMDSQHDGFERDDVIEQVGSGYDNVTALETGFISSDLDPTSSPSMPPIFQLGRVQYAFPAPLALLTVSSNILTMCLYSYSIPPSPFPSSSPTRATSNPQQTFNPSPPRLVRINLDDPTRTSEADVPLPPAPRVRGATQPQDPNTMGPHRMFADPHGRHTLLSMRSGDNFYWTTGWKKAKILPKLKGLIVESVAWNKIRPSGGSTSSSFSEGNPSSISRGSTSSTLSSTREILIGTKDGDIFELILSSPIGGDGEEGDFLDRLTRRTGGGNSSTSDVDKLLKHVFTLPERQPITGLSAEPFPASAIQPPSMPTHSRSKNSVRAVVIATTSTRIYEFVGITGRGRNETGEGEEGTFDKLFATYRADSSPNLKSELPGDLPYSELHTWAPSERRPSKALAWLTGPGVYHGFLSFGAQEVGDSVIDSANLLPYPAVALDEDVEGMNAGGTVAEIPLSISLTEFHFILLYRDRVMGISSLDDRVVFSESLPLRPNERVISTAVDPTRRTYWVYTDSSIFELVIKEEDRDIWRVYLERGNHEMALNYAKVENQRDLILSSQGDRFFNDSRFIQAAQCYAQTVSRSFEDVVLAFIDKGERDALRYYLVMRLERLRKSDEMQRVMLATWLVEIYLAKINELEDVAAAEEASQDVENYRLEQEMLEEELQQFLVTYKNNLDRRTTFSLLARHGRTSILLHYASIIGDYERIVRHWVKEEEWEKAIDTINRQSSLDLYYRFASVLMRHSPSATVTSWQRQPALSPRRLIPAMLQHRPRKEKGEKNEAVRYLRHVIDIQGSTDSAVHNFILTLLAADGDASSTKTLTNGSKDHDQVKEDKIENDLFDGSSLLPNSSSALLSFIDASKPNPSTRQPYYDLDYALRTCATYGRVEACVRIYAKMGLYESAVDLALGGGHDSSSDGHDVVQEHEKSLTSENSNLPSPNWTDQNQKDIELACSCAEMVEGNDDLRKNLWLRIAKFVVKRRRDIKAAMEFLSLTPLLSIEDILPFFPDFFIIDNFKSEICLALEGYASRIEELKSEMDEATRSAESIRKDMDRLGERFVTIEQDEKCGMCSKRLMERGCYVFPCRHGFHADCLIAETTRHLPQRTLRRILELQEALSVLTSGLIPSLPPSYSSALASSSGAALGAASSFGRRAGAGLGLDKLREYVLPDAIVGAISTGVGMSVEGGRRVLAPLDPFTLPATLGRNSGNTLSVNDKDLGPNETGDDKSKNTMKPMTEEEEERVNSLRDELDGLVASSCVICEGTVAAIGRGFIREGEEVEEDWSLY